jgi:hypothetical protein
VSPDIVRANVLETMQIATYTRDVTQNLLSGNPSLVLAASTYQFLNPKVFNVVTAVVGLDQTGAQEGARRVVPPEEGTGIGAELRSRRSAQQTPDTASNPELRILNQNRNADQPDGPEIINL